MTATPYALRLLPRLRLHTLFLSHPVSFPFLFSLQHPLFSALFSRKNSVEIVKFWALSRVSGWFAAKFSKIATIPGKYHPVFCRVLRFFAAKLNPGILASVFVATAKGYAQTTAFVYTKRRATRGPLRWGAGALLDAPHSLPLRAPHPAYPPPAVPRGHATPHQWRAVPRPRAPSRAAPTVAAAQTASIRAPTTTSGRTATT